ncbi:HAD-IIA family hydrolase [Insolitispirillum peregrinum]|uniref:HAD-superfamily class IIA hydrolase, TIGR01459 n=1 Tax=Insolitispirillum peregrinum TaxID=80876 RepID=A0A1N7IY67_9PROT|nr:HAD hydrolase-like protein [Insolitispirillum peregrinum]SIS42009.1 HAD-superfamily class IIA hydrolase, TIGR01459 [Insolitispirillum peregrinum]
MLFTDFADAWQVYLQAGPRLPAAPAAVTPQRVKGLVDVLDRYQVLAFDAYGVLHCGDQAFPQAVRAVALARQAGKSVCVLTNDVTREPAAVAAGLRLRGFDFAASEVISGRTLLPKVLREAMSPGQVFGVISSVPEDVLTALPDFALRPLAREPEQFDAVDGFLFIDNNHWEDGDDQRLEQALLQHPRPLIVCNPDVGCPFLGRMSAEPGYYAHRIAGHGSVEPLFLGKPFPAVYEALCQRFPDVSPAQILMIGDSPHTDVLGSRSAGLDCLLVESGFLSGQDSQRCCQESGLWPDWIAPFV